MGISKDILNVLGVRKTAKFVGIREITAVFDPKISGIYEKLTRIARPNRQHYLLRYILKINEQKSKNLRRRLSKRQFQLIQNFIPSVVEELTEQKGIAVVGTLRGTRQKTAKVLCVTGNTLETLRMKTTVCRAASFLLNTHFVVKTTEKKGSLLVCLTNFFEGKWKLL